VWRQPIKTLFKTKTALPRLAARRPLADHAPAASWNEVSFEVETDLYSHHLFPRHVCMACPINVKINHASSTSNNGGALVKFCCPAIKTVTKTRGRTLTRTLTKTVAKKSVTIKGRAYYDLDNNLAYNNPPDIPIAKTRILIIVGAPKQARAGSKILGSGTTDDRGLFSIIISETTGQTLHVVKDNKNRDPLLDFSISGEQLNVPVPRPSAVAVTSTSTSSGKAVVNGTGGIQGNVVKLYDHGKLIGSAMVLADGTFSIASTAALAIGNHPLTVVQVDSKGAVSNTTDAGLIKIPVSVINH
jgi:hypothetical protein